MLRFLWVTSILLTTSLATSQHDLCGIWVNKNFHNEEYKDVIIIKEVCGNQIVGNTYDQDENGGFCNYRLVASLTEKTNSYKIFGACSFAYENLGHIPTTLKLKLDKHAAYPKLYGKKWITGVGVLFPKETIEYRKISADEFIHNTSYARLKFYINSLEGCECVKSIRDSITKDDRLAQRENKMVKRLEVQSNDIKIFLKDANKNDGDKVSVYLDGKMLVSELEVKKKAKKVTLSLPSDGLEHELIFVADNVGKVPPNTADIEIKSGKGNYHITLNCDMKNNNQVILIKK